VASYSADTGHSLPARLAQDLEARRDELCERVATAHLASFPELAHSLRNVGDDTAVRRLRAGAVDRFHKLVTAILTFGALSLAEQEYRWCSGILPRYGVRQEHHIALVRTYAAEARALQLDPQEIEALDLLCAGIIDIIRRFYPEA
jgi:hypothetical protein